jgi:hypothetical protein
MANSAVTVLGGRDLFLLGIHHLTEGLKALAGDSLRRAMRTLVGGRLSAVVSGDLFTVVRSRGHRRDDFRHNLDAVAEGGVVTEPGTGRCSRRSEAIGYRISKCGEASETLSGARQSRA